jgi:hypothetical protein
MMARQRELRSSLAAGVVYALGGIAYYVAVQQAGVDFKVTPFLFGVTLLGVSVFRRDSLPTAIPLVLWGIAVLLAHEGGPIEAKREGAVYVVTGGLTAGLFVLLQRWIPSQRALIGMATLTFSGLSFVFVIDKPVVWTVLLVAAGVFESVAGLRVGRVPVSNGRLKRAITEGPMPR